MTLPFALACLWFIAANVIAMLPSRDHHWTAAYWLIGCGVPLLGWLTVTHGPVAGMVALAMGASVLRWPFIYLVRWLRRTGAGPRRGPAE